MMTAQTAPVSNDTAVAIGVDVGGTFTDFVLIDDGGRVATAKVPSTPSDQSVGVMEGLGALAEQLGSSAPDLLARCAYLVHGTTVATNMMLQLSGATTAIVTTKGFRDIIDIRRNYREADFDIRQRAPDALVPRRRRVGVTERVDSSGRVVVPLDEDELRTLVTGLVDDGVRSIAVCYLFSFLNAENELRSRDVIREIAPDVHVSLSHEVLPRMREFERVSTTAVDAFVTPDLSHYLNNLARELASRGFAGEMYIMAANGGMLPLERAAGFGAQLVLSGPAGGVVAGSRISTQFDRNGNAITVDMGGTSYDICLIEGGSPVVNSDAWMNRYRVAIPTLDMKTIGAGGGSIARVDVAGRLTVGPESAGAVPGPACFAQGGELPTVTDVNLYLGLLDEASFLGGAMTLDKAAAERAIEEHVARAARHRYGRGGRRRGARRQQRDGQRHPRGVDRPRARPARLRADRVRRRGSDPRGPPGTRARDPPGARPQGGIRAVRARRRAVGRAAHADARRLRACIDRGRRRRRRRADGRDGERAARGPRGRVGAGR